MRSTASNSPVKAPKSLTPMAAPPTGDEEPLKVFVLPSGIAQDSRFVLLGNPRDGSKSRYIFCPNSGLFEITKVGPGAFDPRSILFTPNAAESGELPATDTTDAKFEGVVNKVTEVFVATHFDPIFLLLPILDRSSANEKGEPGKGRFQSLDDLLDDMMGDDSHARHVMTNETFRLKLVDAMDQICDSVDAADEKMYRLDLHKLHSYLVARAQAVVHQGLPASLEDRFVTKILDVPILSIKHNESTISTPAAIHGSDSGRQLTDESESRSDDTTTAVMGSVVTEAPVPSAIGSIDCKPSEDLYHLQRLRTALSFIIASYLGPELAVKLSGIVPDGAVGPDFRLLDEHLQLLAKLRAEALATRPVSDFRKRRNDEEDEAAIERAEKKEKLEDEEKRKRSQESRGVRDLKKADISGMKKMSDFFTKKPQLKKQKV